jgi:hypothetical protein
MADPIRWTRKGDRSHERPAFMWDDKGQRVPVLDDKGRAMKERVPTTGRVGVVRQSADVANTKPMRDPVSMHVLRADGHEVHVPIRSSSASLHGTQGTDTSLRQFRLAKNKHEGWILVGSCPVDLVMRRELNRLQMDSPEVRAAVDRGEACGPGEVGANKPPCKHYVAERAARRKLRFDENQARNDAHKSEAAKQTEALVDLMKTIAPGLAADAQPAPAPAPAGKGASK